MTGSNSISATVDNILGAIRVGELGGGTADLYTATGELEVGVPRGTAARLDAQLDRPGAPLPRGPRRPLGPSHAVIIPAVMASP
jgi:hypothetical protein